MEKMDDECNHHHNINSYFNYYNYYAAGPS
jgi:hypothetical protein